MTGKMQITIVGMGMIGASAGLAMHRYADKVTVVGHDRDNRLAGQAKALGAVDRTEWNLINAVSNADRILLALPVSEIRETLDAIKQDLKPGCLLLDTANVKVPVLRWAAELLPDNVHMVGGHPILVAEDPGISGARADLFQDKLFCLTAGQREDDMAVRLAADFVEALGAKPFFLDSVEHDGMMAAVEHLPSLLAGALMDAARKSPAWTDMRKLAGSQFYTSTLVLAGDGQAAARACLANREHVLRWIDEMMGQLGAWRESLLEEDQETLAQAFDQGLEARRKWLEAQARGVWEEPDAAMSEIPTTGSQMRQLIGLGGLGRRPPKPKR